MHTILLFFLIGGLVSCLLLVYYLKGGHTEKEQRSLFNYLVVWFACFLLWIYARLRFRPANADLSRYVPGRCMEYVTYPNPPKTDLLSLRYI